MFGNIKKNIISICLTILILLINLMLVKFNLHNLINNNDKLGVLIGTFASAWIVPYMIIAMAIQVVVLFFTLLNKKALNIVTLIIEVMYLIFVNFAVVPFMTMNLTFISELVGLLNLVIFEILNIYILVIMIKKLFKH